MADCLVDKTHSAHGQGAKGRLGRLSSMMSEQGPALRDSTLSSENHSKGLDCKNTYGLSGTIYVPNYGRVWMRDQQDEGITFWATKADSGQRWGTRQQQHPMVLLASESIHQEIFVH